MKLPYLILPLLLPFLCTCDSAQETEKPLPNFGRADRLVRYDTFSEVEGLFQQRSDTTYVINFWATWCKPCLEELPLLQKLAERKYVKPLQIVLVNLDREEAAIKRAGLFLATNAPDPMSIILTDPDDATWGKTFDRVWSGSLPTTVIYRGELQTIYRRAFNTYADLERAVEPFVGR